MEVVGIYGNKLWQWAKCNLLTDPCNTRDKMQFIAQDIAE